MGQLARLGDETWFRLGDRDLATHLFRTERLRRGDRLTDVALELARSLGVPSQVLPMTDGPGSNPASGRLTAGSTSRTTSFGCTRNRTCSRCVSKGRSRRRLARGTRRHPVGRGDRRGSVQSDRVDRPDPGPCRVSSRRSPPPVSGACRQSLCPASSGARHCAARRQDAGEPGRGTQRPGRGASLRRGRIARRFRA